jgi:hypothetical protein
MSRYRCHTNIDEGRNKQWPEDFVTCPRVGDRVAALCGYTLKVASITHCVRREAMDIMRGRLVPYIEVELNR